jgi:succinate dehydrogenase / fumarate reductase cytochrome b subunit
MHLRKATSYRLIKRDHIVRRDRPINLDLTTIKFPITATASILHRISGIIVFIALAIFLTLLNQSLTSETAFNNVMGYLDNFFIGFIIWASLTGLAYHIVFGVRHMIQDLGYWEELESAALSAKAGFVITAIVSVLTGVLVW